MLFKKNIKLSDLEYRMGSGSGFGGNPDLKKKLENEK